MLPETAVGFSRETAEVIELSQRPAGIYAVPFSLKTAEHRSRSNLRFIPPAFSDDVNRASQGVLAKDRRRAGDDLDSLDKNGDIR